MRARQREDEDGRPGARRAAVVVAVACAVVVVAPSLAADAAAPAVRAVDAAAGAAVPCGGLEVLAVDDLGLCTHGPDHAPAAAGTGAGRPVPRRGVTCVGDGRSGQRVEVLHVHGSNRGSASSGLRDDVLGWVEQVEWTVVESARAHGGDRRVRWMTDDCDVRVLSRRVSDAALVDFNAMIDELRGAGFRRADRTYLLFVDDTTYCGIATAPRDDSATDNRADRVAGYARVDRGCWGAGDAGYHSIAAHELFHTLGAVQSSAPNATSGAHCTDEHDLLCYDDGSGSGVRTVCRDGDGETSGAGDGFDRLLDCRGDDYFNPRPRSGTYLATHWNTADSARLHDPDAREPSGGGGGGGSSSPPSPTGNPVGYAFWLVFG